MKKIIATIIIFTLTLTSIFALNVKTGYGVVDKSGMQVSSYTQGIVPGEGCAILGDDYEIYSYEGLRDSILSHEVSELLVNLQANDKIEFGCVCFTFDASAAVPQTKSEIAYLRHNTFLGVFGDKFSVGVEANGEMYNQNTLSEKIIEVGASFNSQSKLTKHLSINTKVGAYMYPVFSLTNVKTNTTRESLFSTGFEAEMRFESNYFNFYVGAGIKSWQSLSDDVEQISDLVGGFVPTQIRNSFKIGGSVGLKDVKLFADYNYFCDHPEMSWERFMSWKDSQIFTNNNYGILTFGVEITM